MNKGVYIKTADIYLRFPEIMEEECNDLAEFLEDEHIVYEGATDVFIEKDKEIERLNNIIKLKTDFIHDLLEIIYYSDDTPLHSEAHLIGEEYEDKLKELKEKSDKE